MTFKRFLEGYLRSLSKNNTCNIRRLVEEISENHRLIEPLYLYSSNTNKTDYLMSLAKNQSFYPSYLELSQNYTWDSLLSALEKNSPNIGVGYHKVYNSYIRRRDTSITDNETKKVLHKRIKELQAEKRISNYRIYTDLNLNAGNANAFLANCDTGRLNLDIIVKIWMYLKESDKRAS